MVRGVGQVTSLGPHSSSVCRVIPAVTWESPGLSEEPGFLEDQVSYSPRVEGRGVRCGGSQPAGTQEAAGDGLGAGVGGRGIGRSSKSNYCFKEQNVHFCSSDFRGITCDFSTSSVCSQVELGPRTPSSLGGEAKNGPSTRFASAMMRPQRRRPRLTTHCSSAEASAAERDFPTKNQDVDCRTLGASQRRVLLQSPSSTVQRGHLILSPRL